MVYHRSDGDTTPSARDRAPPTAQSMPEAHQVNAFRNDGSFLEMFKRMQEANSSASSGSPSLSKNLQPAKPTTSVSPVKAESGQSVMSSDRVHPGPSGNPGSSGNASSGDESSKEVAKRAPLVGKRRGGRVLPTGVVKKKRADEEGSEEKPKDAWSLYMAEVKRYKETSCEEDGKTRPLVK
ncbi:telomerase RNA component interacting RNase-like isoform X1 [Thrips palmi]|uniref:Telomerase RNA component interacting RNase-like isoform X1 n=1 Tax=Thrips palmi TaxID=161013 RepID=A0A6P9A677_THRPL|nr:telomerase RNA component interacting RNase-like isoform X1 [Thrips palmi]XP_034252088.1 telomerase RNA component interacting RNase-like isoform X1 [Thrips palmi]